MMENAPLVGSRALASLLLGRKLDSIPFNIYHVRIILVLGVVGFVEGNWIGRRLKLGGLELRAQEDTKRCGVTFISQPGLHEDPEILRNILRNNKRHLGIYCSTDVSGTIETGDEVFIAD